VTGTGLELPAPEEMDDALLGVRLWELIQRLASLRIFLSSTEHLRDRELYTELWSDILRQETKDIAYSEYSACHIDLLGSGSDEHPLRYMRYFAGEDERRRWMESFPDYEMPPHEDPPHDRDRHLPQ